MGYYTRFETMGNTFDDEKTAVWFSHKMKETTPLHVTLHDNTVVGTGDSLKWYSYADNMKELSVLFPDCLIELHGEGEEQGDLWKARFKNGKSETVIAKFTYPEFTELL